MCSAHYQRVRIHGDPLAYKIGKKPRFFVACKVDGCDRDADRSAGGKRGFCSMHYSRFRKHGDPNRVVAPQSPAKDWAKAHAGYAGDDCLTWPFAVGADGYGRVHRDDAGPLTTASNYMCELAHGPKPSRIHECAHSCGNGHRACVNPKHLRWATPTENQRERAEHGTSNRGERQWNAALSRDDIREMRRMASIYTNAEIAEYFNVHQSHVSKILSGERWQWLE